MKQKYVLTKRGEKESMTISEYAEVEKDTFSLICEENYAGDIIRGAIAGGEDRLISTFRTHNMYPRKIYAEKITRAIVELFKTREDNTMDLVFDDKDEFIHPEAEETAVLDDIEKEAVSADELLDDDDDDDDGDETVEKKNDNKAEIKEEKKDDAASPEQPK